MEVLFREVSLYAQCISNSQGLSLRLHERTGQSSPYMCHKVLIPGQLLHKTGCLSNPRLVRWHRFDPTEGTLEGLGWLLHVFTVHSAELVEWHKLRVAVVYEQHLGERGRGRALYVRL